MKDDAALYNNRAADGLPQLWSSSRCGNRDGRAIFTIVLATLNRKGGSAFYLTAITAPCYVVAFAIWFVRVSPHQWPNQRVDDHVRASELDAVAQSVGAVARSTRRSLSGRI